MRKEKSTTVSLLSDYKTGNQFSLKLNSNGQRVWRGNGPLFIRRSVSGRKGFKCCRTQTGSFFRLEASLYKRKKRVDSWKGHKHLPKRTFYYRNIRCSVLASMNLFTGQRKNYFYLFIWSLRSTRSTKLTVDIGSQQSVCAASGLQGSATVTTGCPTHHSPAHSHLSTASFCLSTDDYQDSTLSTQGHTQYMEISPKPQGQR